MRSEFKEFGRTELLLLLVFALLIIVAPALAVLMAVVVIISSLIVFYRKLFVLPIFDFYIKAVDILRNPDKVLFGFELKNVIGRGEKIIHRTPDPPPLVYFALGALHERSGSFEAAIHNLSFALKDEADEKKIMAPSRRLRKYVSELRKIESQPSNNESILTAIL
ncbi:MAG: hypothetical protein ACRD63_14105, partial [Pyrinomonadaceae bacterium]